MMRKSLSVKYISIIMLCLGMQVQPAHSDNATTNTAHSTKPVKAKVKVYPGKAHEECLKVTKNQELPYQFSGSEELMFNIHYHGEQGVIYPIPQQALASLTGTLKPKTEQRYCLMWVNDGSESVKLSFKYQLVNLPHPEKNKL